jgi:hypothetical protein
MHVKTNVKAGLRLLNHNQALVRAAKAKAPPAKAPGLKVKTNVKAGIRIFNHNEALARAGAKAPPAKAPGLRVKTNVRPGLTARARSPGHGG